MSDAKNKCAAGKICLRPHHLLCLAGFQGKGYSEMFVSRMAEVSQLLKRRPDTQVCLHTGIDDLCAACPHKTDGGGCDQDDQVLGCDERTLRYLHLDEGTAPYEKWMRSVNSELTPETRSAICGDCNWTRDCLLARKYDSQTGEKDEDERQIDITP